MMKICIVFAVAVGTIQSQKCDEGNVCSAKKNGVIANSFAQKKSFVMGRILINDGHPAAYSFAGTRQPSWEIISATKACEGNNEGISRTFGARGFTLESCKAKCTGTCEAIDFYASSGWCNTFDVACTTPRRQTAGSSSYRRAGAYFKITSGSCDEQGGVAISDMTECENAARAVGFDFGPKNTYTCSEHPGVCNNRRPQGCFKEANQLALFPDSTGDCSYWGPSHVSTACFCKKDSTTPSTTPSTTTSTSTTTACQIVEDNDSFRDQMGLSCNDWPNGDCMWAGQWGYSASGQRALVNNCMTTCGMCELPQFMREIRGINYCSGAYTKIASSAECKTGSRALGHYFSRYDFNSRRAPTGCFNTKSGGTAYYNRKPNGRSDSFYSPICVRKPETANEPTTHGYVLVRIRHECKAEQKWVSCTKKTVKDCADHVREAGGKFFQFGIDKQHGQCFMKKTNSEHCSEGFKGSPFYNFYKLGELPTTAAPTTVAPTTTSRTLAPDWRDVLLNKHNNFRVQEGSSSMPKLIWDTTLEESSQKWVDKCTFGHSFADDAGMYNDCANNACGQQNGENLWMGSDFPDLETAVYKWYIEKLDYSYDDGIFRSGNCAKGKMCGHYTQLVSASTLKLGCAVKSDCTGEWKSYIVCQYSPAGNVEGDTLFKKNGAACSECPIAYNCCDAGLCVGTPPVALTGAFSWDMMCDGDAQHYMLNTCEATPLTSTGRSHQIVTLTAQERMWAITITLYNDSSCSSDRMDMDAQEVGICDSQIGFNNKFTYDGPDNMPIAPNALTNGECSDSTSTTTTTTTTTIEWEYFSITGGTCGDEGGSAILDMAECKTAANAVGFKYGQDNTYTCSEHRGVCGNRRPQGCFKEMNSLNLFPDSTGACSFWGPSWVSTACFCKRKPVDYFKITSGRCDDQDGMAILDMSECKAAASALGFRYRHDNTYTCSEHGGVCGNRRPQGCFKEWNNLNLFPDSTGACSFWGPSWVSTACFCKKTTQ